MRDYTILLKSRTFLPPEGGLLHLEELLAGAPGDTVHLILQFYDHPSAPMREELQQDGVELLHYIPNYAWLASLPRTLQATELEQAGIRWVGLLLPSDKISPHLLEASAPQWASLPDGRWALDVEFCRDISSDDRDEILDEHGCEMLDEVPLFNGVIAAVPPTEVEPLANEDGVLWLEIVWPAMESLNDGSRTLHHVDPLQAPPISRTGLGVNMLVFDAEPIWDSHPDFEDPITLQSRVIIGEPGTITDGHSTHVAGTAAGAGLDRPDRLYRGMAPSAGIISYYITALGTPPLYFPFYDDPGDMVEDYTEAIQEYDAHLANNSIGTNLCFNFLAWTALDGDYERTAATVDDIIRGSLGRPLPGVWAAGNERSHFDNGWCQHRFGDYKTMGIPATAKNAITVGAVYSDTGGVTEFSSWGPTDDGRIKPDVVAAGSETGGAEITSCAIPDGYTQMEGTSMAAPAVTGILALLMEEARDSLGFDPRPAALKAHLVHDAQLRQPPTYEVGYGIVDAQASYDHVHSRESWGGTVDNGESRVFVLHTTANQAPIRITLAWDDPPGERFVSPALKNTLPLWVWSPSGVRWLPWTLELGAPALPAVRRQDVVNNVRVVDVPQGDVEEGCWRIEVEGFSVAEGPQPFALLVDPPLPTEVAWRGCPACPPPLPPQPACSPPGDTICVQRPKTSPRNLTLYWNGTEGAELYDIYRGTLDVFGPGGGAYNHEASSPGTRCKLPAMPAPNTKTIDDEAAEPGSFYYLIGSRNICSDPTPTTRSTLGYADKDGDGRRDRDNEREPSFLAPACL